LSTFFKTPQNQLAVAGEQQTLYNTYEMHLFTNNLTVNGTTLLSDLTEAAFTGYMAAVQVFDAPYNDPSLGGASFECLSQFTSTAVQSTPEVVYGYYFTVVISSVVTLVSLGNLDTPVAIANIGDAVVFTAKINIQ
jgi:hypothetical protein